MLQTTGKKWGPFGLRATPWVACNQDARELGTSGGSRFTVVGISEPGIPSFSNEAKGRATRARESAGARRLLYRGCMLKALLPREHGAYAEILLPLAAVLMAGEISGAAALLTMAALCGFLAHEPMSVLLGRRGERKRVELESEATSLLALLVVVGAVSAAVVLWQGDLLLRAAILAPLGLVAWSILLLTFGQERTTAGEIVIATTLASSAIPIGVAAGLSLATSVAIALVWAIGAGLATATVRGIILAAKLTASWQPEAAIGAGVVVLASAAVLSTTGGAPVWLAPALCPLALLSVLLGAFRPRPARVRQVGWSFVAANLVTLGIVVAGV